MARYKIKHDQPGCISCGACEAVCSENWTMKDINGEIKAVPKKEEIDESELAQNKEAAESCPVNVIHIRDEQEGKDII